MFQNCRGTRPTIPVQVPGSLITQTYQGVILFLMRYHMFWQSEQTLKANAT